LRSVVNALVACFSVTPRSLATTLRCCFADSFAPAYMAKMYALASSGGTWAFVCSPKTLYRVLVAESHRPDVAF
jgi:hypothetical protein